jgi:diaminopimelate epimerase
VMRFEKWEGLGNDFIVIGRPDGETLDEARVRALCDRRRGIGADGVLMIEGAEQGRPRMIVYNADGSRPEMCGNGLRCVAAYLASASAGLTREILVATDAGEKRCVVQESGPARYDVTVDMGTARLGNELRVRIDSREHRFQRVDVGNPHAITFDPYDQAEIDHIGPTVATSVRGGTNVEFCRVHTAEDGGSRIDVVVWERGVGRTLACGTGACAVAAAACEVGRTSFGVPIRVGLPGGELSITVGETRRDLVMRGPAQRVFAGEVVSA